MSDNKSSWASHQKRWFGKWHVYLGIIAGFIIAFVGVTGSILVFREEIDAALNPQLFVVKPSGHKIPPAILLPRFQQEHPAYKISYLAADDTKATATYEAYNAATEQEIFINPYTGSICGIRKHDSGFVGIVTELHRTLLIPVAGRYIVGLAAICLLILTASGLRLWVPQKLKQLKVALLIKRRASLKRQNYDLHRVVGLYSSPVVFVLALTGVCITFSVVVIPMLFLCSGESPQGVQQLLGAKSHYQAGVKPMPLTELVKNAEAAMPGAKVLGYAVPKDTTASYRFDMLSEGLPRSGKREMALLDQYTGKLLLNSRTDFPEVGNAYLSWLAPLHYGTFGGLPTQILALLGGLMPAVLFISGIAIWWPRFKKQRNKPVQKSDLRVAVLAGKSTDGVTGVHTPFILRLKKGFKYALLFIGFTVLMGTLYGLISGLPIRPGLAAMAFLTTLIQVNLVLSVVCFIIYALLFYPFGKRSRIWPGYLAWSLPFALVYGLFYHLCFNMGLSIF
ncbi:PepSY domain-containing protein [Mucilaginibacter roseus]|uniref:PepSY domain-containing protein n=1 Tax=Mucilaginibacter roseus TaxID=1528868 RepID=A0ABS8U7X0_9SPHI|nr:PepSY domain-containing protein [Mucilaginibacter roseus]MCD8742233.1 PepSY domain-containing protein [Mucilaginibacter roseus]